jgi:RES domain-containing protein
MTWQFALYDRAVCRSRHVHSCACPRSALSPPRGSENAAPRHPLGGRSRETGDRGSAAAGGVLFAGRWHSRGQPITYGATVPSLTLLERLAHVEDPDLLPPLAIVAYEMPDDLANEEVSLEALPADWREDVVLTRNLGDAWIGAMRTALLRVPSVIVPLPGIAERNIVINHRHPDAGRIGIRRVQRPFALDARLLRRPGRTMSRPGEPPALRARPAVGHTSGARPAAPQAGPLQGRSDPLPHGCPGCRHRTALPLSRTGIRTG